MEPFTASCCRDILDRLRAQVNTHLPAFSGYMQPSEVLPLERLPTVGAVVQQYIEAEAVYASANPYTAPPEHDVT